MKSLICCVLLALSAALSAGCANQAASPAVAERGRPDLTSGLQIEAGKSFMLGGGQPKKFFVEATNEGPTVVEIVAEVNGRATSIGKVGPGGRATHEFAAGEMAVLINESPSAEARLKVLVWGEPSTLGMTYRPNAGK